MLFHSLWPIQLGPTVGLNKCLAYLGLPLSAYDVNVKISTRNLVDCYMNIVNMLILTW